MLISAAMFTPARRLATQSFFPAARSAPLMISLAGLLHPFGTLVAEGMGPKVVGGLRGVRKQEVRHSQPALAIRSHVAERHGWAGVAGGRHSQAHEGLWVGV
jgi:hypothetical protein